MATAAMQLISRIIHTGELAIALDWGVNIDDFLTPEEKGFYNLILSYYQSPQTSGSVPGPYVVAGAFPGFVRCDDPRMTTPALCHEARRARTAVDTKAIALELADAAASGDPFRAIAEAQAKLSATLALGASKNTDVTQAAAHERLLLEYQQMEQGLTLAKMFWPWQPLNDATGGLQKDDFIVFYGRPKSMKSWVLSALIAWGFHMGKRILIYTKEMTADNIFKRVNAAILEIPYQELRTAQLSEDNRARLFALQDTLRDPNIGHNLICLSGRDAPAGGDTISWIQAKAEKYMPDIICIDGLYLLSSSKRHNKDHERVMQISRETRAMQLATGIPIVATMQATRSAAKHANAELDEIAYSDAVGQDATITIRVINDKEPDKDNRQTISLILAGSREFKLHGFKIYGEPATNFRFHSVMEEADVTRATMQDAASASPSGKGSKRRSKQQDTQDNVQRALDVLSRIQ